jgi:hypothetical protein
MTKIFCESGETQIGKVLAHARDEAGRGEVKGVVFVGDAFEELIDDVISAAVALGTKKVPVFMLQEGKDPEAERAFKAIAHLPVGYTYGLMGMLPPKCENSCKLWGSILQPARWMRSKSSPLAARL